jgi:hypothetical protein
VVGSLDCRNGARIIGVRRPGTRAPGGRRIVPGAQMAQNSLDRAAVVNDRDDAHAGIAPTKWHQPCRGP